MRALHILLLVGVFTFSAAFDAAAVGESHDRPGWRVIQCSATPVVPVGASGIHNVLVANPTSGSITVFEPTGVGAVYHFDGAGSTTGERGYRVGTRHPERRLDVEVLHPGEMVVFNFHAPVSTRKPGKFSYRFDVCIVPSELGPADYHRWLRADAIPVHGPQAPEESSVASQACAFFGGVTKRFRGSLTVVEPTGNDKAYYDAYIRPWITSGNLAVKRDLDEKRRRRSRELKAAEPPADPSSLPFSEIKQRQSFKELEDNRYAALAWVGGERKITLFEYERRNLSSRTAHRYEDGSASLKELVFSFEKSKRYVDMYNLRWGAYLGAAVSLFGTSQEQRGFKAVQRVATSSPDCVARYLAKRVLEVYDEVRGGKKH